MSALVLPAPLDGAEPGAWVEYGKRTLSWGPLPEGSFARNTWAMAWVDVSEREPWRGEPLWLYASRRRDESWSREPFTDTARRKLHDLVVPQIARYGFHRLWVERRRARTSAEADLVNARAAGRVARWWQDKAALADLDLDLRPPRRDPDRRHPTVLVARAYAPSVTERVDVIGEAWYEGEQIGWVTGSGEVVPTDELLR